MEIRRRYAWMWRRGKASGWELELYAADFRALARLGERPRRLARIGFTRPKAAAREIRREADVLRTRCVLMRRKLGIAFEPVMVVVTRSGQLEESWISNNNSWREMRTRLQAPEAA